MNGFIVLIKTTYQHLNSFSRVQTLQRNILFKPKPIYSEGRFLKRFDSWVSHLFLYLPVSTETVRVWVNIYVKMFFLLVVFRWCKTTFWNVSEKAQILMTMNDFRIKHTLTFCSNSTVCFATFQNWVIQINFFSNSGISRKLIWYSLSCLFAYSKLRIVRCLQLSKALNYVKLVSENSSELW